jgi:hypothetical protein
MVNLRNNQIGWLERALREAIPNLGRIVHHAEPPGDQASDEVS